MKYNAEQVAFMLHEAIDENREYKSWHVSTQHLMTLVERVVAEEREACAKVCEGLLERPSGYQGTWEGYGKFKTQMTGQECATAIRARGQA